MNGTHESVYETMGPKIALTMVLTSTSTQALGLQRTLRQLSIVYISCITIILLEEEFIGVTQYIYLPC